MFARTRIRARARVAGVAAAVVLAGSGAVALAPAALAFDSVVEVNSSGGTSSSNGLRISYGSGQIQVKRQSTNQVFYKNTTPSSATNSNLYNGIYLRVGDTLIGPDHGSLAAATGLLNTVSEWDTITTSGGSSGAGSLGSTLTWTDPATSLPYSVDLTLSYTSTSDDFFHETLVAHVPAGNTKIVKLYRTIDTQLNGRDRGPGFYNTSSTPSPIVGVIDDSALEAFRYTGGPAWTGYWSGRFSCMYRDYSTCPGGQGYLHRGLDLPASRAVSINADPDTDNGMGINWDLAAAQGATVDTPAPAGATSVDYDLLFTTNQAYAGTAQTITFPQPPDVVFGSGPITLNATTDSGLPVTYLSRNPSVCSVSGNTVTQLSVGYCSFYATQPGTGTYRPTLNVDQTFQILQAPQVISFPAPATAYVTSGPLTLTAASDSGLPVTYTSTTPAVCTVSGSALTFLSTGTCTVAADQAGDTNYTAATTVTTSLAVIDPPPPPAPSAPPSVTALTSTGTGTAPQHATIALAPGATATFLRNGQPATTVTETGVGTYTLDPAGTITFTPAPGYAGTPTPVIFQVTNTANLTSTATYTPTVTKPAPPAPAALTSTGEGTQHATITHHDGDTLTLLDSTGTPTTAPVTITGEGTYTLNATTGVITFTPAAGFTGIGVGIGFQATDAYGQTGMAAYVPTITATTPVPTPQPTPTTPVPAPAPKPLPKIDRKNLIKIPANPKKITGKERKTKAFNSSFTGRDAHPIVKLGARQLKKGQATTLSGDGLFDFDSARLTKKGRAQVKAVVFNLKGTTAVKCEGYTDYAGARNHELDLSAGRAKAVCTALKMYGAKVKTTTKGYGPQRPVVVGGTAKGRKENRRVVILVTR